MKSRWGYLARLLFSGAVLYFCFRLAGDVDYAHLFAGVQPGWYLLAFLANTIATIVVPATVAWYASRIGTVSFSLPRFIKLNFALRFYSVVMPRGIATGMRWLRYRSSGRGDDALALMMFEVLVQFLVSFGFTAVFLGLDAERLPRGFAVLWYVSIIAFAGALVAFLPFLNATAAALFEVPLRWAIRVAPAFIGTRMEKLWRSIVTFQHLDRSVAVTILAVSVAGRVVFIWAGVLLAYAMGIEAGFLMLAWIRSVVFLMQMLPVTVAGLGVREAGFIALMSGYGVARGEALAYSLTLFSIALLVAAIGGLFELYDLAARRLRPRPESSGAE